MIKLRTCKPEQIRKDVAAAVKKLTGMPGCRVIEARMSVPRLNSRENLQRWLTPESQTRVIALAAEFERDVAQITTVAINLYSIIAHNPEKHSALLIALKKVTRK